MSEKKAMMDTSTSAYTTRLVTHGGVWWKRLLNVQAPYRWNLRRLAPGYTLDVGCGLGRNLLHIDGHGVGVDHNQHSIATARRAGLVAYTPADFENAKEARKGAFDSILLAHVAEHMQEDNVVELVRSYLPYLKPTGQVIFITPQEAGQLSDATHVQFMDFAALRRITEKLGLRVDRTYSFPFPRLLGRAFKYNEFVVTAKAR